MQRRFRKNDSEHLKFIDTDKELIKKFLREKIGTIFQECMPPRQTKTFSRRSFPSGRYTESSPGRLIHADVAGPFVNSVKGHYNYLLVLVDDHTRFKFAFPLVDRAEAPSKIRSFIVSFNKLAS